MFLVVSITCPCASTVVAQIKRDMKYSLLTKGASITLKMNITKKSHPEIRMGLNKIGDDLLSHNTQYHRRKWA